MLGLLLSFSPTLTIQPLAEGIAVDSTLEQFSKYLKEVELGANKMVDNLNLQQYALGLYYLALLWIFSIT